jgi:hypothetical protein
MKDVEFGFWESYGGDGRKRCHNEQPAWWNHKARAHLRAGLGYCGYNGSDDRAGDYAWSQVFDTYEEAYAYYCVGRAECEPEELEEGGIPASMVVDIEEVIRQEAKAKYGAVLSLIFTAEAEYRLAIAENDPEYQAYPAMTISAFPTASGIRFDKADYYLTIRAALEQLDKWEATERERIASLHRPQAGRGERQGRRS